MLSFSGPFRDVARHVVGAKRTHPELSAGRRQGSGSEVRAAGERVARIEDTPGHGGHASRRHVAVARRLLPLKDRWQPLAPKRGVSGGLVPRDIRHRIVRLAVRNRLIRPGARTGQSRPVHEGSHGFVPRQCAPVLDERVIPELTLQIAARVDELLVLLVGHFVLVDQVIVERHAPIGRTGPSDQAIVAARHEHHARGHAAVGQEPLLRFVSAAA